MKPKFCPRRKRFSGVDLQHPTTAIDQRFSSFGFWGHGSSRPEVPSYAAVTVHVTVHHSHVKCKSIIGYGRDRNLIANETVSTFHKGEGILVPWTEIIVRANLSDIPSKNCRDFSRQDETEPFPVAENLRPVPAREFPGGIFSLLQALTFLSLSKASV